MKTPPKYNVVIIGVSYFDGMASSIRVRNLLKPALEAQLLTLSNLIYKVDAYGIHKKLGIKDGVNYLVVKASSVLSVVSLTWQGARFLKKCKSSSSKNILYNYQYIDIKNLLLLLYARAIGYKIILDIVEDNNYYTTFASIKSRLKIMTSLRLLKLTPVLADYVITISHHLHKMMSDVCKDKIPVSLIPITVDLHRFRKSAIEIPDVYKIFYGGSFGAKDGIEYLIKAFGEISETHANVELIMTGRASKEDFKKLESYLGHSKARNKITHKGFLEDDAYYRTMNECHIFCMTRVNSEFANAGFPFKLGEFLSTGKAVIATDIGDIKNYLQHRESALIISPESVSELVEALTYLLENPEEIYKLGKNGRAVAEENFDTYRWSEKLTQFFDTM